MCNSNASHPGSEIELHVYLGSKKREGAICIIREVCLMCISKALESYFINKNVLPATISKVSQTQDREKLLRRCPVSTQASPATAETEKPPLLKQVLPLEVVVPADGPACIKSVHRWYRF